MTRVVALVVTGLLLMGCTLLPEPLRPAGSLPAPTTRDEAQAAWLASGVDSYTATITVGCMCSATGTYVVQVVDGVATAVAKDGVPIDVEDDPQLPMTVTDQFALAHSTEAKGGRVDGTFDPELGYPRTMIFDAVPNGDDDELYLEIVDLTPTR